MGGIWEERGECGTRSVRLSRSGNTKHRPTSAMACEMAIATRLPAVVVRRKILGNTDVGTAPRWAEMNLVWRS